MSQSPAPIVSPAAVQAPAPRSAPGPARPARPGLLAQVLPPCLFLASLGFLVLTTVRALHTVKKPVRAAAHEGVDVFSLSRTPSIAAGRMRYAILGLGQDSETGQQIVWIRSITTNRIGGFAPGDQLFGSAVALRSVSPDEVVLSYHDQPIPIAIQP